MKKMFISVVALAISVMAMATETAYVELRLTGHSGLYDEMTLTEDDIYTNAYEDGADAAKIMYQANTRSVLIYGIVDGLQCGDVAAENLDGHVIGFKSNMIDDQYTLSFEYVELAPSRTLQLYDRVTGLTYDIVDGESFNFTIAASLVGQKEINDRFYINMDPASIKTVTTNAYGFCSFASATAVTLPAGLKAYKGDFEASDYSIALTYIGQVVPANTGVILWTPEETSKEFAYVEGGSAPVVSGNDFVGVTVDTDPAGISATSIYCLHGNELQKYVGTDPIPAGKAYLPVTVSGSNPAPKHVTMRFNNTTAVDNVEVETVTVEKFIENGQIFIRRGNEVFNLQGQSVK